MAAIVIAVVALDQASKAWAVRRLADGPVEIVGPDVALRLTRNSGGAFSLFRGYTALLAVLAVVFAVVLARAVQRTDNRLVLVALALVLGGALGNLVDRLVRSPGFLRGHVVDFVDLGPWPTFNAADAAITVGAALLVVGLFREDRAEAPRPRPGS